VKRGGIGTGGRWRDGHDTSRRRRRKKEDEEKERTTEVSLGV
jgi:hypothetical protein